MERHAQKASGRWPILMPLAALVAVTLILDLTGLDILCSRWCYDSLNRDWPWLDSPFCSGFYNWGIYPPALVAIGGILIVCYGAWFQGGNLSQNGGWFLLLLMAIGPGLVVNVCFKEFWGRPRPYQLREFGGEYQFSPVYSPGSFAEGNSSFPSGHVAVAFYMMAPGFLVSRSRPRLGNAIFLSGIAYGLCMAVTRVLQGRHFISDVLWSAGIVYMVSACLSRHLLFSEEQPP